MPKRIDRTGMRYGNLLVLEEVESAYSVGGQRLPKWLCKCDCGSEIVVFASNLTSGHTTGCKKCGIVKAGKARQKHGHSHERIFRLWSGMKARCYNKSRKSYSRYGAQGITVCDEWMGKDGFENFYKWAIANGYKEEGYALNYTIDRINNRKGYSPDNCRIASAYVQANNREYNHYVEDSDGDRLTLKQLARKYDIGYGTIHSRWMRGIQNVEDLKCIYRRVGNRNKRVARFREYGNELKTMPVT